jgi:fructose-bisphosphate aldolase class II
VLHGGTGIPEDSVKKAIKLGVNKINVGTAIRAAFTETISKTVKRKTNNTRIDPREMMRLTRVAMKTIIKEKMRLFGSVRKE